MVDVVSRIKLLFVSQGAEKAAKQTEQIGRAQTRLGQASASAGRQFSSQASGMGGLVAAYAGAAANIFAITMAFSALSKAARQEQTIAGVRTLATAVGESGDAVIKTIQEITDGQLSMAETAEQANLALSAGFSIEQIEGLTRVATKASIALGRDLTDSMGRLVRGAAKVEPEILDELGIIVRLDKAVEKYAQKLGKAASSLTLFERSQAFTNEIIEQGESKFSSIDDEASTSIKSFEQLSAKISDLAQQIGGLIAGGLGPVVDFITGNFLNTLSVAGLLGGVIFRKLGDVGSQQLLRIATSAEIAGTKVSNFLGKSGAAEGARQLTASMQDVKLSGETMTGQLIGMTREARNTTITLLNKAKTTRLTATELRKLNAAISTTKGTLTTLEGAALAAANGVKQLGIASKVASVGFGMAARGLAFMARGINLIMKALGKIFFIVSMVQLVSTTIGELIFGVDLFADAGEKVGKFFKTFREEARIAKQTGEVFTELLHDISGAAKLTSAQLDGVSTSTRNWYKTIMSMGLTEIFGGGQNIKEGADAIKGLQTEFTKALMEGNRIHPDAGASRYVTVMTEIMDKAEAVMDAGTKRMLITWVESLHAMGGQKGWDAVRTGIEMALRQGFSANAIAEILGDGFKQGLYQFDRDARDTMEKLAQSGGLESLVPPPDFEGISSRAPGLANLQIKATDVPVEAMGELASLISLTDNYLRMIADGTITTERFTRETTNQNKVLDKLDTILVELAKSMDGFGISKDTMDQMTQFLNQFRTAIRGTDKAVEEFALTMDFLNKSFDLTGLAKSREWLGPNGALATTAREFKENKFRQVVKVITTLGKITNLSANQATTYTKALKALAVEYPNVVKGVEKLTKEIEKLNRSYTKQINLLVITQSKQDAQNELKLIQLTRKESEANNKQLEARQKRNVIANERTVINLQKTINSETQKLDVLKSEHDLRNKMLDIEYEREKLAILALTRQKRANLDLERGRAQAFGGLYTEKDLQELEIMELKLNVEDAERLLEQQREFERKKMVNAMKIFDNEVALLETERKLQIQQTINEERIAKDKKTLLVAQLATAKQEVGMQNLETLDYAKGGLIEKELTERKALAKAAMDAAHINADAAHTDREVTLEKMKADADFLAVMTAALAAHPKALSEELQAHAASFGKNMETSVSENQKSLEDTAAIAQKMKTDIGDAENRTGLFAKSDEIRDKQRGLATSQHKAAAGEGGTLEREANLQHQIAVDRIRMLESEAFHAQLAVDDFEERKLLEEQHHNGLIRGLEIQMTQEGEAAILRMTEAELNLKNAQDALTAQQNLNNVINNQFTRIVDSVSESIQGRVSTAVRDLTTAMNEGTLTMDNFKEGFKSFIVGVMQDIQQAILDELVTKLINNMISEMANSLSSSFSGAFASGVAIGGYAGRGSTIQRFAGGGGVFQRDRVPALLEPGEFVIRKPMAKAIGGPALQQMNAHGTMPAGNVEVNMINKGTPQSAQVEQKPQIDGKGIVIEIVLNDLKNNGPIKQAMRGGGSR